MKNKKIALCAATLAFAGGMLAGCKNKNKEVTLDKVSFSGISKSYNAQQSIHWENFVVTFSYSDSSAISFTSDKMEFDVETPVKSETELLVKTNGLYASDVPHEEKTYNISVALKEDFTKFYDLGNISVFHASKDKYALMEYSLPRNITNYQTTGKNAGKDEEGSFKKFDDEFLVGTVNPWKFEPVATFAEKANISNVDDFTNYEKEEKLYVVEGATETEISESAYKRIVIGDGQYQFSKEDAGKKFKIVVSPKEFAKDAMGDDVKPVQFTFTVQEGYNIYNAKQLGVLNLTNLKSEEFVGDHAFAEHYRVATATLGEDGNGQSEVFITKPGEANPYGYLDLPRVWEKFLIDNGTLTDSTVEAARDVKGVFLQNDVNITPADIPSEYFMNMFDPVNNRLGGINTGGLRDDTSIYTPIAVNELTISGNYFKLDTHEIPLCKNTTDGATCDAIAKGLPIVSFTEDWDQMISPGHATLIKICGVNFRGGDESPIETQKYADTVKRATIKNILTVGNTGKDITGVEEDDIDRKMKVTGLIFAKATKAPVTMENIIIQEYMIGLFADNGIGQAVGDVPQTNYTFVKDCKVFDCSNSGLFNYEDGGLEVSGTTMKRFGGACIINAGCAGDDGYKEQPNTIFHNDCVFYNPITGGEVYFAAVGASSYITRIVGFDGWFTYPGYESAKRLVAPEGDPDAGKMNLIALQMDGAGYVLSNNKTYAGTIKMSNGDKDLTVGLGEPQKSLAPFTAYAKTEAGQAFVMPSEPAQDIITQTCIGNCQAMTADLLDLDICLGSTILSCVFDLYNAPQKPAEN